MNLKTTLNTAPRVAVPAFDRDSPDFPERHRCVLG